MRQNRLLGGLYDVVIDGITDILKSVQGEEKAVSNAKQLIDIFLQDLDLGRNWQMVKFVRVL